MQLTRDSKLNPKRETPRRQLIGASKGAVYLQVGWIARTAHKTRPAARAKFEGLWAKLSSLNVLVLVRCRNLKFSQLAVSELHLKSMA